MEHYDVAMVLLLENPAAAFIRHILCLVKLFYRRIVQPFTLHAKNSSLASVSY